MAVISGITISGITASGVTVKWNTDVVCTTDYQLWLKDPVTSVYTDVTPSGHVQPGADSLTHTLILTGLTADSGYKIQPKSYDNSGLAWATYTSGLNLFDITTLPSSAYHTLTDVSGELLQVPFTANTAITNTTAQAYCNETEARVNGRLSLRTYTVPVDPVLSPAGFLRIKMICTKLTAERITKLQKRNSAADDTKETKEKKQKTVSDLTEGEALLQAIVLDQDPLTDVPRSTPITDTISGSTPAETFLSNTGSPNGINIGLPANTYGPGNLPAGGAGFQRNIRQW